MNDLRINRSLSRWITLGLGIVGLVVTAIAVLAAPGNRFTTVSYISLAVGLLGLIGFVLLDPQAIVTAVTGRTGQYAFTTWLMSIAFVALVIILFIIVQKAEIKPLDLTKAGEYQLSDETIDMLENLDEDVAVYAFYGAQQTGMRDEAEIWLREYRRYSNDRLSFYFVDPDLEPLFAQEKGGRQGVIIFEQGDRTAEANFISESTLTSALYQVQLGEPRKLYYTTGHGERGIDDFTGLGFSQVSNSLGDASYEVVPFSLFQEKSVPGDADLVVIAGPTTQFSPDDMTALRLYLAGGGRAFIMLDFGTGSGGVLNLGVLGVDYNHDGSLIATAGADGTAKIWDALTGDELVTLRGHSGSVKDVSFSADGEQVATADADGTVLVWDAEDGEQLYRLEGQTIGIRRLDYSPDGKWLVSVGDNQVANVWDATTYEPVDYSPLPALSPLLVVAFSPDSSVFAAGGSDGQLYVWDTATGESLVSQALHTNAIFDLQFSEDSKTLYSISIDGRKGTFDLEQNSGSTEALYPDVGISAFAIAPDGREIYALGDDGTIHVRPADATSAEDDEVLTEHTDAIWSLKMSPDNIHFITSSKDGDARVWNLDTLTSTLKISGHSAADPLIAYLAESWGVIVNDDLVIDTASSVPSVPIIFTYATDSPITRPLDEGGAQLVMPGSRSVEAAATIPQELDLTSLMFSSSGGGQVLSWGESNTEAVVIQSFAQYDEGEDTPGPVVLAISAENMDTGGRVVVVGDADFPSNSMLQNYSSYQNEDFFFNVVNWLAEGDEGPTLPRPDITERPKIDRPLTNAELTIFAITGTCILPLIGLIVGVVVWVTRRRRR